MQKKFFIFFTYKLPAGTLSSVYIYNFCENFVLRFYFTSEKREGSGSGFVPLTKGPGSGRSQNMRIRIPNTAWNFNNSENRYVLWPQYDTACFYRCNFLLPRGQNLADGFFFNHLANFCAKFFLKKQLNCSEKKNISDRRRPL